MTKTMRKLLHLYVRFVQRVLISVLLTLLYAFGFGITYLLAALFRRRWLRHAEGADGSYWTSSVPDPQDLAHAQQQS